MLTCMAFTITFSSGNLAQYDDDCRYKVEDNGTLKVTAGGEVFIYSPTAWSSVQAKQKAGSGRVVIS